MNFFRRCSLDTNLLEESLLIISWLTERLARA